VHGSLHERVAAARHSLVESRPRFFAFRNDYLPRLLGGARHLEIGPGHGLLLYFKAATGRLGSVLARNPD
ncbi:MAG: hypothetical protein ABW182_04520, partial [Sphingomonas sp.]